MKLNIICIKIGDGLESPAYTFDQEFSLLNNNDSLENEKTQLAADKQLVKSNCNSLDDYDYDENNKSDGNEIQMNNGRRYFEAHVANEGTFQISIEDWDKLRTLQKGHRFLRGEWEDYFVLGMKGSNKYCVFAFKDHYVNQSYIRKRKTYMDHVRVGSGGVVGISSNVIGPKDKKLFSANGYCVFEDCSIKFFLKMNSERIVHVYYEGEIRHCVNEVHARYFRGIKRYLTCLHTHSELNLMIIKVNQGKS